MENNKKITRKVKAAITRENILKSAYSLFVANGIKNVSVEMITKEANVAKGSFYVHFKSKNALVNELASSKISEVDMDYENFLMNLPKDTSATDMLLMVTKKIMTVMTEVIGHEELSIIYETLLDRSEDISPIISSSRKIYNVFNYIIEKGIKDGEFRSDLSAHSVSSHLLIALRGLTYQWCVLHPEFDIQRQSQEHISILINGLINNSPTCDISNRI